MIEIIETWMTGFPDNDAILDHLEQYRVPAAPVMDPADAIEHPYYRERGMINEFEDPVMGPMAIPGFPLRFSERPEGLDLVGPTLGQHNSEVLKSVLGYSEDRITDLADAGVLVTKNR